MDDRSELTDQMGMAPAIDRGGSAWMIDVDSLEDNVSEPQHQRLLDAGYAVTLEGYDPLVIEQGDDGLDYLTKSFELFLTPDAARTLANLLLRFAEDEETATEPAKPDE
jgi:hypothetical protein